MKEINIMQAAALTSPAPLVLVCTEKENGALNMAPVSFFMYASFNPPMLAFGMGKASNTGANIRRTGKAVLAVPGDSIRDAVMAYGSVSGTRTDKLKETPVVLRSVEGSAIQFPEDSRVAFVVSLEQTVEAGDHYLYICSIETMAADADREALFAWDGYTKAAPAREK